MIHQNRNNKYRVATLKNITFSFDGRWVEKVQLWNMYRYTTLWTNYTQGDWTSISPLCSLLGIEFMVACVWKILLIRNKFSECSSSVLQIFHWRCICSPGVRRQRRQLHQWQKRLDSFGKSILSIYEPYAPYADTGIQWTSEIKQFCVREYVEVCFMVLDGAVFHRNQLRQHIMIMMP